MTVLYGWSKSVQQMGSIHVRLLNFVDWRMIDVPQGEGYVIESPCMNDSSKLLCQHCTLRVFCQLKLTVWRPFRRWIFQKVVMTSILLFNCMQCLHVSLGILTCLLHISEITDNLMPELFLNDLDFQNLIQSSHRCDAVSQWSHNLWSFPMWWDLVKMRFS